MFFRIKKVKNKDGSCREYLCGLKAVRVKGKVKQIPVANFGRLDKLREVGAIDDIINKLSKYAVRAMVLDRKSSKDIGCLWSKEYGAIVVLEKIWDELEIGEIIKKEFSTRRYDKVIMEAIKAMVITRITEPGSDLSMHKCLGRIYRPGWEDIRLEHIYKGLDFLIEHKDKIEVGLFERMKDLFSLKLDLIMFDTTSISYTGEGEEEFVEYGYNREHRKGVKQVLVGILMTQHGLAIGHEVWSGSTSDIRAMEKILDKIKHRFNIQRIIFICDRGMVSNSTLEKLEELKYEYIVGIKMRRLNEEMRRQLLTGVGFEQAGSTLEVKDCRIEDKRYIVCYNPIEAEHEKIQREYFTKILEKKVEERSIKDWIIKNGYKKYLNIENAKIEIDYSKLRMESVYDGKWVLSTNTDLPAKDIGWHYKGLWQIERNFKKLKSELEVGPVYHWTESRIRAHIFVCFLALVIRNILENKINVLNKGVSYKEVIDALRCVEVVNVKIKDEGLLIRTELPPKAHIGFEAVKAKIPPQILECKSKTG